MVTAADLSAMTKDELDALPYGAIRLSAYGTILSYNATEGRLTGRTPERVLGRNFFLDVAPCTDVQEFHGRFRELVHGQGSLLYEFTFEFPFNPPARVSITFLRDRGDDSVWVLIEPLGDAEADNPVLPTPER
ncbi:MAG TPA: PAS domain-containing protein [Pyrinomonadaceae bacterium]|nr:PAS domain-containing protein [Pyrinomonadaceae bacterium]